MATKPTDIVYSSKDVARFLSVTTRTIQLWADMGLVESWKTPGGHRRYTREAVDKLYRKLKKVPLQIEPPSLSVVIVEDSQDLLLLYKLNMANWPIPIEITTATDGYEGLIKVGSSSPDILISDLLMPNMDGFQMVKAVRNEVSNANLDIIIVTGLEKPEIKKRGKLPKGVTVLCKPIPFDTLQELFEKKYQSLHGTSYLNTPELEEVTE